VLWSKDGHALYAPYHWSTAIRAMLIAHLTVAFATAYPAAKALYYGVGFREFTRELSHIKRAEVARFV
jgi:hypothetical protein